MAQQVYRRIVELVSKASDIARTVGIANLLQPGLVKEMIIADILGHELIPSNRKETQMPMLRTIPPKSTNIFPAKKAEAGNLTVYSNNRLISATNHSSESHEITRFISLFSLKHSKPNAKSSMKLNRKSCIPSP